MQTQPGHGDRVMDHTKPPSGLPAAVAAYLIWGMMPAYLLLVHAVPPYEFVGLRIIFTLPLCLLFIAVRGQFGELRAALANPRAMLALAASALIIGGNWLIYIVAVQGGHVFAASLGYYINPILNVLMGTLFLKERLSRLQWLAVALASAGIALLAWDARDMLWFSLTIALSFSVYGLIRKLAPVGSLPGLTIESLILFLPAIAIAWGSAAAHGGSSLGRDLPSSLLIAFSGPMTAVPLLLFAVAARRMDYSTLGFVQFLAPTMVFFEGLLLFHEPLRPVQLACFVAIWTAIAVFVWDLLARRRAVIA